jgi:hypothetical protein
MWWVNIEKISSWLFAYTVYQSITFRPTLKKSGFVW